MGRVWIVGAGASIGNAGGDFPGIFDFFTTAHKLGITSDPRLKSSLNMRYMTANNYIKKHFGHYILSDDAKLDIEQLLTYIEIEKERSSNGELIDVEEKLKELIRKVLIAKSKDVKEDDEYKFFKSALNEQDSIISFNWDSVLDKYFVEQLTDKHKWYDNKHRLMQYANFIDRFAQINRDWFEELQQNNKSVNSASFPYTESMAVVPVYLKAHGSIDWYSCANTMCNASSALYVVKEPEKTYFCSKCHEQMINVLIPPVLNKRLNNHPAIRKIWTSATRIMENADEIIIWGYSLPPTDFNSHWLMRQARKGSVKKLTIINPAVVTKSGKSFQRQFIEKFTNIFDDLQDVRLYMTMTDFNGDVDIFKKYPSLLNKNRPGWIISNNKSGR